LRISKQLIRAGNVLVSLMVFGARPLKLTLRCGSTFHEAKSIVRIAAIEAESQVGPSFGNNFNNRTEEAIGSALDLWTAFREGAFNAGLQPFLGYFFMLEDCPASNRPVKVKEPHFKVFPEFIGASYTKRYELLCRKLILERHYTSACFLTSNSDAGLGGEYNEPAKELSFQNFAKSIASHVGAFTQ